MEKTFITKANEMLNNREIIDKDPPSYVYHYTSGIALKSIIENGSIWLSERDHMNDVAEVNEAREMVSSSFNDFIDRVKTVDDSWMFDGDNDAEYINASLERLKINEKLIERLLNVLTANPEIDALFRGTLYQEYESEIQKKFKSYLGIDDYLSWAAIEDRDTLYEYLKGNHEFLEGRPNCDYLKNWILVEIIYSQKNVLDFFDLCNNQYVFSTSLDPDSINMWCYYSQSSEGFCLELDAKELEKMFGCFCEGKFDYFSGKVIYDDETKKVGIEKSIQEIVESANNKEQILVNENEPYSCLKYFYSMSKQKGNTGEAEYRYTINTKDQNSVKGKEYSLEQNNCEFSYEFKRGLFVPTLKIKFEKKLPIKRIIVGPKNKNVTAINSLKNFLKNNGYENVQVEPSELSVR